MYDVRCTVYALHDDDRNEHLCAAASLSSANVLPPVSKTGLPNSLTKTRVSTAEVLKP